MKTWVISDASPDGAAECDFFHFWTPRGLTSGSGSDRVAQAKRCGWKNTIAVQAKTHREAAEKAKVVFDRRRAKA